MLASMLQQVARLSNQFAAVSLRSTWLPQSLHNSNPTGLIQNVRFKVRIRGCGRPLPEGQLPPIPSRYGWRPILPPDGKYTIKPLPILKMGGRHPETGRVVVATIGGGNKKKFRWVDHVRAAPKDGPPLEERVFNVRYDPLRSAKIALVASGEKPRWIIASENLKPGDIVRTYGDVPRIPVRPKEGDAHPLGALPAGTLVHSVEMLPGRGGILCNAAGSAAVLLKKVGKRCIVQLPSKQELSVSEECMAVVGRVSNVGHNKIPIGSPNRHRWFGKRPRSGLWHRKDGYCGRKIRPPKPIKVVEERVPTKVKKLRLSLSDVPIGIFRTEESL